MPIIAKIETQKKNNHRFNIYFLEQDQAVFAFGVSEDTLVKFNLRKGLELTELDIEEIQFEQLISKAFQASVNFISFRARSEKEIVDYLKDRDYTQAIISEVCHRLDHYRYLDDLNFARSYVANEMKISRKGPNAIKQELTEKGVSIENQLIVLEEYPKTIQYENASYWAKKQFAKQKTSSKEMRQKVLQFLNRKGFSYDISESVITEFSNSDVDVEWTNLCTLGNKYHRKYHQLEDYAYQQKMTSALYRKGFDLDLIHRFLKNDKERISLNHVELE